MMRQRKKGLAAWLVLMCLMAFWIFPAWAAGQEDYYDVRVFDEAGLFTDSEIETFEMQIQEVREQMGMDLVLVTTDDALGLTSEEYADGCYENGGFGEGDDYRGALLLIDMDNRMLYVSTEGAMIRFLTDDRIEEMMDHAIIGMQQGDYAAAAESLIWDVQTFYEEGIPDDQYNYDRETGRISVYRSIDWLEALLAFVAAAVTGGVACWSVKKQYGMEQEQGRPGNYNMAYQANSRFAYRNQNDAMVNQFVSRTVIPRPTQSSGSSGSSRSGSRSTTHRSSGGRTHGGGGRGF